MTQNPDIQRIESILNSKPNTHGYTKYVRRHAPTILEQVWRVCSTASGPLTAAEIREIAGVRSSKQVRRVMRQLGVASVDGRYAMAVAS